MKKENFISLNSEITEFNLQELELRLETDPLAVGGLLDVISMEDKPLLAVNASGCDLTCNGVNFGD